MSLGREIELVQRHKAEEDIAVAAASILARHEFVSRLAAIGETIRDGLAQRGLGGGRCRSQGICRKGRRGKSHQSREDSFPDRAASPRPAGTSQGQVAATLQARGATVNFAKISTSPGRPVGTVCGKAADENVRSVR